MIFQLTKNLFYTLLLLLQQTSTLTADDVYSCGKYNCGGDRLIQPCACDDLCEVYGDCCRDHVRRRSSDDLSPRDSSRDPSSPDANANHNTPLPEGISKHIPPIIDLSLANCVNFRFSPSYFLVNRCPIEWNDEYVRTMCEAEWPGTLREYLIPVTSHVTGLSYKNTFCAVCHNEGLGDVRMWAYHLECKDETPADFFNQLEKCDVIFEDPARRLCIGESKRCPANSTPTDTLAQNCNRFVDYVIVRTGIFGEDYYHNAYCLECYGLEVTTATCYNRDFLAEHSANIRVTALSSLADIRPETDEEFDADRKQLSELNMTLEGKVTCDEEQFTYSNGRCLKTHCPFGFNGLHNLRECKFDNSLVLYVCSAEDGNPAYWYRSIITSESLRGTDGVCDDTYEKWNALPIHPITNISTLRSTLFTIRFNTGFYYRKLAILHKNRNVVANETKNRFSQNCRKLNNNHGYSSQHLFMVFKFVGAMNQSAPLGFFSFVDEKKTLYQLDMEICDMEVACHIVSLGNLLKRDMDALGEKAWLDGSPYFRKMVICKEDVEAYEDEKRLDRNRKLVQFFRQQGLLSNCGLSGYAMKLVFVSAILLASVSV